MDQVKKKKKDYLYLNEKKKAFKILAFYQYTHWSYFYFVLNCGNMSKMIYKPPYCGREKKGLGN